MDKQVIKSRRERRKEARVAKQHQRLQSWIRHQSLKQQKKKQLGPLNSNQVLPSLDNENLTLDQKIQKCRNLKLGSKSSRKLRTDVSATQEHGTKFEQGLEMEKHRTAVSADEVPALDIHLAKKLKVKAGRFNQQDDAINDPIDGVSTYSNFVKVDKHNKKSSLASDRDEKDEALENTLMVPKKKSKLKGNLQEKVKLQVAATKKQKTKFEEYLEMEEHKTISAEEDLAMEKRLAKKLKVKGGKFGGSDDGLNDLLDGICSFSNFEETEPHNGCSMKEVNHVLTKKKRNKKKSGVPSTVKSISPAPLEESASPHKFDEHQILAGGGESRDVFGKENAVLIHDNVNGQAMGVFASEQEKLKQPVTSVEGIQSDDSESIETECLENCSGIFQEKGANFKTHQSSTAVDVSAKYVAPHLRSNLTVESNESAQIHRRIRGLLNKLSEFNVESIAGEVSTVFQSHGRSMGTQIVAGEVLASCCRGPRGNEQYAAVFAAFVAGLAAVVGMDFGAKLLASVALSFEEEYKKGDNLALRNLTLLLAYLYKFGLCSSDLIYDLLTLLSKRLEESDASTILTILQCCGMSLRRDDPAAMKDFVLCIQQQVHDLKMLSAGIHDKTKISGKRMEFMLETICDIKNNKRQSKDEPTAHTRLKKWLQKLRLEDVQLHGIKWDKLLDPSKKGQWWLSGDTERPVKDSATEIADVFDTEVAGTQKILELATAQRMNTDARRAIFCVTMSGEDYLDAFEKILRLNLPGKQDREILRVIVECCLQEKVFNKYYSLLATKLCHHDKNHKFTLQYCLWDHFKQLDSMELRRLANLARFLADMIGSFALSLAVLKAVDFSDSRVLASKVVMHFRILFETLFTQYSDAVIWNIFTRIACPPELESLRVGLELFIHQHVTKNPITGTQFSTTESSPIVANRFKVAKKALANVAGVLM